MEYEIVSKDVDETVVLAENIESEKFSNMVICLDGDLGSGKTIFAKGFARALGITEDVISPTFTLIKEYNGELPLFHMDVYRLDGKIDGLGLEEYFEKDGVVIIEWANTIEEHLPEERLDIEIKIVGENTRNIYIRPKGSKYEEICEIIL